MSEHYHDAGDLRFLKEMSKLAPTEFSAWLALDKIVTREDGAIPRKYRELIALAVAFTTQCPYCIEGHVKGAKTAGASRAGGFSREISKPSKLTAPRLSPGRASSELASKAGVGVVPLSRRRRAEHALVSRKNQVGARTPVC